MRSIRLLVVTLFSSFAFLPQDGSASERLGDFWTPLDARPATVQVRSSREVWLRLDEAALRRHLSVLPAAESSGSLPLYLPAASGELREFEVSRSLTMAPELAAKFPEIQTYQGWATDGSAARVRFEVTPIGFGAMSFSTDGVILIEADSDSGTYVSFVRERRADAAPFTCGFDSEEKSAGVSDEHAKHLTNAAPKATGPTLRTYRTAIAATAEYTTAAGGSVGLAMGRIVSAVNRLNQIYETDLGIRLALVANNDLIVYTNSLTDPYTNNNGSTMLGQNQTNLTTVIGSANYDFGHVFSTGGGGVATRPSVCIVSSKARGVTGLPNPINDPFWIDFVAHEMGHQLNGPHTFNGTTSNCSGANRSASSAYEVGSGTTIMAYAGICGGENVQNNSDPFFHVSSLQTIHTYTQTGTGASCGSTSATGNNTPTQTATADATIPARTPFALTANAVDPDGDTLTYVWEQFDLDPTGSTTTTVNQDNGLRPLFRSFDASSSSTRLFPRLENILSNTQTIGEVMPTTTRNLSFRVTVRDNRAGGGGVQWTGSTAPAVAQTEISVVDTGVGFAVTAPNTAVSFAAGSSQPVTWAVAGTDVNGINCANVDIAWSSDGGRSFPVSLLAATPNDGSENVTLPNQATTAGRVRITCSTNIFFDINDANVTLTGGNAAPVLTLTAGAVTYTTNGPAIILDGAAVVSDADSADFNGGNLLVSFSNNGEANDRLEVRNEGTGPGQIGVSGATITFGGVSIGTLSGGVGVVPMNVALTSAAATPAAVQALMRNVTYRNISAIAGTLARTVAARVSDGDGGSSVQVTRNVNISVNANPFIALIDDGDADNLVGVNIGVNYAVQFSKDVNLATVTAADFVNLGTATAAFGAITEPTAGTVNVVLTPSSAGTLILQIPAGASIQDASGLNVPTPFQDNDTLNVDAVIPTLTTIDDGDADNLVLPGTILNYVLTFSEDVDLASAAAADFNNAGTSTISIGAITEPTPGVLNIAVTATSAGTLILRLPVGATVTDVAGNPAVAPVQDNNTVLVDGDRIFIDGFDVIP